MEGGIKGLNEAEKEGEGCQIQNSVFLKVGQFDLSRYFRKFVVMLLLYLITFT